MTTNSTTDATESEGFKFYHFTPSLPAAIIFAVLFLGLSVRHCQLLIRERAWFFIPFLTGCLLESIGYAARAYSSTQSPDWTLMPYIIQSMLILLGPAFFAASIYMTLGRLIRFLRAEQYSLIRVNWLTKLFLLGDILSILGQAGGGGILASASSSSSQDMGNRVILLGLGIQVAFFGGFMIVITVFHYRIVKGPTKESRTTAAPWHKFIFLMYTASVFIMVRSVFRMAEYAQGNNGSLIKREMYVYVLDALLMTIVGLLFMLFHPAALFVHGGNSVYEDTNDSYPMVGQNQYARMA